VIITFGSGISGGLRDVGEVQIGRDGYSEMGLVSFWEKGSLCDYWVFRRASFNLGIWVLHDWAIALTVSEGEIHIGQALSKNVPVWHTN
jgi:predicted acetyltransferase